jgi:hypothetical protein
MVDGIGNGDAMAIKALHSGLDVVDVLRRATVEAAQPRRVVDAVCVDMAARPKVVPKLTP